ncbi:MAG: DNA-3-methyladenine glycosylase [Rhodomicrobium sp.]|nr:MAG: DNA-3-methyladenine glycosylase [Rhodomicrobium sp.]
MPRCGWAGDDPLYIDYHDTEWGVPERSDEALFEKLILEGFQAGLSWITILRKRENFRRAFEGFDPEKIVRFDEAKIESLMGDAGIIRNRKKIEAATMNARAFLDMRDNGENLSSFFWDAVDGTALDGKRGCLKDVPSETPLSKSLSKELKRRGFKFVGPVTVYAHMQAMGLVNDHVMTCPRYEAVAQMR